jgi:hypothetical protein
MWTTKDKMKVGLQVVHAAKFIRTVRVIARMNKRRQTAQTDAGQ